MANTPEGKIKRKVTKMLKELGIWYFMPQAGPYGRAGVPDYICCVKGELVGIECKADHTRLPTKLQLQCMNQIEKSGGKCFVVYDDKSLGVVRTYVSR